MEYNAINVLKKKSGGFRKGMGIFRCFLILISVAGMINILCYYKGIFFKEKQFPFDGKGTSEEPYIIQDKATLKILRDLVNEGEDFEDIYFLQSSDIDLEGENWTPIGIYGSENYFMGIYDGGAHFIQNLIVSSEAEDFPSNGGFFGILDGTVKNLGIESGTIEGNCVGAFASHGTPRALILNCYNKASVNGTGRAGGICDNLNGGTVINCVNEGQVSAPVSAQIVSYDARSIMSVYPNEDAYTDNFTGTFLRIEMSGNSFQELLNSGLDILMENKVILSEDIIRW